jgi:hypothetical protein
MLVRYVDAKTRIRREEMHTIRAQQHQHAAVYVYLYRYIYKDGQPIPRQQDVGDWLFQLVKVWENVRDLLYVPVPVAVPTPSEGMPCMFVPTYLVCYWYARTLNMVQ